MNRFFLTVVMSAALAQGAFAQGNRVISNSPSGATSSTQDVQDGAPLLPLQIKQKLESAGHSDVKVMPTSFVIQAKDRQRDPVEILITPHSMMEVTALNAGEQGDIASGGNSNSTNGNQ